MRTLFIASVALLATAGAAFASFHSAPAPTSLFGLVFYNVEHFVLHVLFTAQMIIEYGPFVVQMLDGICFAATPPMTHVFFVTGVSAVLTTIVALVLMAYTTLRFVLFLFQSGPILASLVAVNR